jgi:uncharacterized membrane protein YhaH (DUF805 family)
MALMFEPLRKYATFVGRARRAEYWLWVLFVWIVEMVLIVPIQMMAGPAAMTGDPTAYAGPAAAAYGVFGLLMLALLLPSLAVSVRRLHDTGRSGWWLLIAFIPFLGALVLLVFTLLDGTPGPNRFGDDPKNRTPADSVAATA